MPTKPKARRRPWMPERKPQEGRTVVNGFYHSTEWRKFRRLYIINHPLCVECLKAGNTVAGTVVDHIKQINRADAWNTVNGLWGEALSERNVQTLCEHHHAVKSGKERRKL
jgi:5-methylcytosine-specific restriction enzyme A